jgi:thiamine transport system ATP-binding protein
MKAAFTDPVLLVDDEHMMIVVMRRILERLGYTAVDYAADGETALEKMRGGRYGLVICDWSMEPVSGYEVLCRVRADPALRNTPFIMATTQTVMRNAVAAKMAGVSGYLIKPFTPETLKRAIETALATLPPTPIPAEPAREDSMLLVDACRLAGRHFAARFTLSVPMGALCAIIGPSGAGKTMLLQLIAGFQRSAAGQIVFDGEDFSKARPADRPVAMVAQEGSVFPYLTVFENVALVAGDAFQLTDEDIQRANRVLDDLDLASVANRRLVELSTGLRYRVALARALVMKKPILLVDEAFREVSPDHRRALLNLVDRIRRDYGLTVLMTVQDPHEVQHIADHMVFVSDGEVVLEGTPEDVLFRGFDRRLTTYLAERVRLQGSGAEAR